MVTELFHRLLAKESIYFSLMGITAVVSFMRTGYIAFYLTPEGYGYYTWFLVLTGYLQYSQFGLINGLGRELPILYGQDRKEEALELLARTLGFLVLVQVVCSCVVLLVIYAYEIEDSSLNIVLWSSVLAAISSNVLLISTLRLRSQLKIVEYSILSLVIALLGLLFAILGAIMFGFYGTIGALICVTTIGVIYSNVFMLERVKLRFRVILSEHKTVLKIGVPMMAASFIQTTLFSIDKVFITRFYDFHLLGLYSFSAIPMIMAITANGILMTYLSPKVLYDYGKEGDLSEVFKYLRKISFAIIVIATLMFPIYVLVVDFVLANYVSKYIEVREIMYIFYFPAAILCASCFSPILLAAKRANFMLGYEVALLFSACMLFGGIVIRNMEIINFAYALSGIFAIGFLVIYFYAHSLSRLRPTI